MDSMYGQANQGFGAPFGQPGAQAQTSTQRQPPSHHQQQQQQPPQQQQPWASNQPGAGWAGGGESSAFDGMAGNLGGDMDGTVSSPGSHDSSSGILKEKEPPLLEELGINFAHIQQKVISTLNPRRSIADIVDDADLAGPLIFCVALGVLLSLRGELHFDYIYHFFLFGSLFMYLVLKLLAHRAADDTGNDPPGSGGVDVLRVFSILGYSLLPIVFLAACSLLLDLQAWYGSALVLLMICWSTYT